MVYGLIEQQHRKGRESSIRKNLKNVYFILMKQTFYCSLELRVPFLDVQFTNYYLNLDLDLKRPKDGVEKYLLRSAFDGTNILPHEILWRHKEAFR